MAFNGPTSDDQIDSRPGRAPDWRCTVIPFPDDSMALLEQRLGQKVAIYRRRAGLTQVRLAKKVRVAPETINRLERGKTMPSIATIQKVAGALGLELSELLRFRERQTRKTKALDLLLAKVGGRTAGEIDLVTALAKTLFPRSR
jgi:transcriptional regulator with XRE-family HTH domain